MHRTVASLLATFVALPILAGGCDPQRGEEGTKTAAKDTPAAKTEAKAAAPEAQTEAQTEAKTAAPEAKANEPEAPKDETLVLEEVELPGLGRLKMPKGYESTADKHWSYDLGNYESINVSWEPHGAPNLAKAESLSKILANAETVKSKTTLESGYHEIERVRESDGFTFISVFGPDWYVKCVAPAAHMDTCREIVRSKA